MPRKGAVKKREINPDIVFGKIVVAKFVNCIMTQGKKGRAERIVYTSLDLIRNKVKQDPIYVLEEAIQNVRPMLEVKPRRVGGATYQVPTEVSEPRGIALALAWIIEAARKKQGKTMEEKLANEIIEAYEKRGGAFTSRINMEKMVEANRAFASFRW